MATEDVIELGSSDDEAEPAPKKPKNIPTNAMVHIPSKLPDLTIKPTKGKDAPGRPASKGMKHKPALKSITVTKTAVAPHKPSAMTPVKINGRPVPRVQGPVVLPSSSGRLLKNPFQSGINSSIRNKTPVSRIMVNTPINIMNKFNNSELKINKVPIAINTKISRGPIKSADPRALNKLPPDITVLKTVSGKRPLKSNAMPPSKKPKQIIRNAAAALETVDLDDDDVNQASTSGPQWYLRPEEQTEANDSKETDEDSLEKKNNAEPEPSKIEITIDDSPIKVIKNKRTHEIGAELPITIDDSPIKAVTENNPLSSDGERTANDNEKTPKSKKKLNYPNEIEVASEGATIEIEIEPIEYAEANSNNAITENVCGASDSIVEIFDSPAKPLQVQQSSTPKKDESKTPKITPRYVEPVAQSSEDGEFHPIYQKFIDLCFKLENSDDMKKIVEKKIKAYYKQVPEEYSSSEDFKDMVSGKIVSMQASPEKMYLYIKDIVDELNLQRKMAKAQPSKKEAKTAGSEKFQFPEDREFDAKRQRQIRKLEKTIKKLHRAIQKLEEQEVDFDDEEDSVYILTESEEDGPSNKDVDKPLVNDRNVLLQRYKERMIRVHAKFCQLTNTKLPSEPRLLIEARPGQPTGPAKRLEKWINRKVPIGTPLPFPDFHDVLHCVREANEEDKLGWNEVDIMEEARDLFSRCGKKLQRRRQENEWRLAVSRISVDIDPAEQNAELKKKLAENKQVATKRETEVYNKFADRQSLLKLEAEEICDKEAEESSADDEEEEETNEESSSLQDKEKRKEKIRQLLQIKKKTPVEEKENGLKENELKETGENQKCIEKVVSKNENQTKETPEEGSAEGDHTENCAVVNDEDTVVNKEQSKPIQIVHSVSDDSNKMESDEDELNLLQKIRSESEMNTSTLESTDTDTQVLDISDTLTSSDNRENAADVISIENSSYSESEIKKPGEELLPTKHNNNVEMEILQTATSTQLGDSNVVSDAQVQNYVKQTSNDEYNDPIGNILLASSEDELADKNDNHSENEETCMNLQDDAISIGDTIVQENTSKNTEDLKSENTVSDTTQVQNYVPQTSNDEYDDSIGNILLASSEDELADKIHNDSESEETCMNLQDDVISIGDTIVQEIVPKNAEYMEIESREMNQNEVIDGTEQLVEDENSTIGSCSDDTVLEKQAKPNSDATGDAIEVFSSFDKNSEVVEEDNSEETIQDEYDEGKTDMNKVTEIISDSNSPEIVNEIQSNDSYKIVQDDIKVPEFKDNKVNHTKATKNSKIETVVIHSNKEEMETNHARPVIAEPIESEYNDGNGEKSNLASNFAASDSVLTKDDAKVSDLARTDDSLDALLEELNSDLGSNE